MKPFQKKYIIGKKFANVEITYKHGAKLGDAVHGFYSKTSDDEHIVVIKSKESNEVHAIVQLH